MNKRDKINLKDAFTMLLACSLAWIALCLGAYVIYTLSALSILSALDFFIVFILIGLIWSGLVAFGYMIGVSIYEIFNICRQYKIIVVIPKGETNNED